jgi:hypothetical protein
VTTSNVRAAKFFASCRLVRGSVIAAAAINSTKSVNIARLADNIGACDSAMVINSQTPSTAWMGRGSASSRSLRSETATPTASNAIATKATWFTALLLSAVLDAPVIARSANGVVVIQMSRKIR